MTRGSLIESGHAYALKYWPLTEKSQENKDVSHQETQLVGLAGFFIHQIVFWQYHVSVLHE